MEVHMPRRRREQIARIETEARKLAWSGQYQGSSSIEMALLSRGYREAPQIFANLWTQYELDRLCDQARRTSNCAAYRDGRADSAISAGGDSLAAVGGV
jgi:hypothetical protein